MGVSDVCPTVDAIRAFLEHLVDPMLAEIPILDDPPLSQQQKVAKQVHAVVLLYNYYHRKQNPELEFVAFSAFCKLIVDLRPALLPYMKFTQKPVDLVDVEQQLSLTEKAIVSSYDICTLLDASKSVPNIEGWPISKVAVLLVDSKKENCFLHFGSITDGVRSLIEKDVDTSNKVSEVTTSNKISEVTSEIKTYKKRRVVKKPLRNGSNVDEDRILQVGYSAVKEAAGVNSIDIMLLESYTVYSQSKEKTSSRFYIMKCSQSIDEGFTQVPIKDLIESVRGPLVKRSSDSWKVTPVVEYFHMLPYSKIISEWISRETFSNSLQDSKLAEKQFPKLEVKESHISSEALSVGLDNKQCSETIVALNQKQLLKLEVKEMHVSSEGMSAGLDNKACSDTIVTLNQKENNGCGTITQCGSVKKDQDMDVDNSSRVKTNLEVTESHVSSEGMSVGLDNKQSSDTIAALNQKENNGCGIITQCGSVKKDEDMDVDNSSIKKTNLEVTESHVSSEGMSVDLDNKPCSDTIAALNQKENNSCGTITRCCSVKKDEDMDVDNSSTKKKNLEVTESHVSSEGMSVGLDNKPCSDTIAALNQKEDTGCGTITQCGSVKKDQDMDVDNSSRKRTKLEVTESHVSSEGMSVGLDNKPCSDTIAALNQTEDNGCGTITQCGSVKKDHDMDVDDSSRKRTKLEVTESHVSSEGMSVGLDNKPCSDTIAALNQTEDNGCGTITQCGSVKKDHDMDVDNSSRKRTKLEVTESHVSSEGMSVGLDNKPCSDTIVALDQKENSCCGKITQCSSVKEDQDMDVDNCSTFPSKLNEEYQKHVANTLQVNEDQKIENSSVQHHSNECTRPSEAEKVVSTRMHIIEGGIKDESAFDKICVDATVENESIEKCTLIADNFNADFEKVRSFVDSKGKMGRSDVCPTADAVRAFVEHLVDPMLPAKASIRDAPSISQQQKVAKQVHSVVLLYNYYHRKRHPELEFVAFKDFCKLIVGLRPALLIYMKFTQKPDQTDLVDVEQQLSLTEKAIASSCDICTCLDASKNVPNIEGWPVSKVAILLVDSKMENCLLRFCSTTDGVWSVIEKDVGSSDQISEDMNELKHTYQKRRVIQNPTKNGLNVDDDEFLQVGYSAVKEATGVNSNDIMLLESYTVYSQRKEKTASRFYIMKCSQSTADGSIQVPIKDLIESFRGPLLKKSSSSWTITSVVEYFHVLPYSEIISDWISRETFSNSLQDSKLAEKQFPKHEVTESHVSSKGLYIDVDNKPGSDTKVALNQKEKNGCGITKRCDSVKEDWDMDVDKSLVLPSKNKECQKHTANTLHISEDQKIENPSVQHHSNECTRPSKAEKAVSKRKHITEGGIKDQSAFDKICAGTTFENDSVEKCILNANSSNKNLEKIQTFIASKGTILSQTALNALIRKRNALALQQRAIEDEMAVCNMKIHRWLAGEEDDFELKLESVIEGCNGTWLRNQGRMCSQYLDDQCLPQSVKSKRLTEAVLTLHSPCQELDGICHENNWILPTYSVSLSDGEFHATVRVKGVDFEYSCEGNTCPFPREARDSAAAQMLTKFRSMA